jgi:uncharacterized protein YfbU (UPF0304 family)
VGLSETEKLILFNQYEILKILRPKDSHHEALQTALLDGYEEDFFQMAATIQEPLSREVRREVRDILDMFRALGPRYEGGVRSPAKARFAGFDANDSIECEYSMYPRFLIETRKLWQESKIDDYSSHTPILSDYRDMLREWKSSERPNDLSQNDVKRILSSTPQLCRVKEVE